MKILLVNSYDVGGAAKACIRLHDGILDEGISSKILFKNKNNDIKFSEKFDFELKKRNKAVKFKYFFKRVLIFLKILKIKESKENVYLNARRSELEFFSYPYSNFDITTSKLYKEADIINLHWVANFLDYESFFKKNKKPVVWTLHDMNPFTGGEHFTELSLGMDDLGLPKQRIITKNESKIFKENIEIKLRALKNVANLHIVVLCNWMKSEVEKSELFKNYKTHLIPNGVDTKIFKFRDKNFSREVLNIPLNKKVILFVADSIDNYRKGFLFLEKALNEFKTDDVILCAIGKNNDLLNKHNNIIKLGHINDERLMSMAYSAADVFVIPSLMDNLPNTILESVLCGTPVIGFPVGGIVDVVENGINGLITKEISVNSLVETIKLFFNTSNTYKKEIIINKAVKKYSQKVQSESYINLFERIYSDLNK